MILQCIECNARLNVQSELQEGKDLMIKCSDCDTDFSITVKRMNEQDAGKTDRKRGAGYYLLKEIVRGKRLDRAIEDYIG